MTRPRIWKGLRFGSRPWCATHPDNPNFWRLCETWREAMDFVNEKLENPFPLTLKGVTSAGVAAIYEEGTVFLVDRFDGETIALNPRDWRPLARALTRLADKEGHA